MLTQTTKLDQYITTHANLECYSYCRRNSFIKWLTYDDECYNRNLINFTLYILHIHYYEPKAKLSLDLKNLVSHCCYQILKIVNCAKNVLIPFSRVLAIVHRIGFLYMVITVKMIFSNQTCIRWNSCNGSAIHSESYRYNRSFTVCQNNCIFEKQLNV